MKKLLASFILAWLTLLLLGVSFGVSSSNAHPLTTLPETGLLMDAADINHALSDPPVTVGLWVNYGAGTPGFPTGYGISTVAIDGQERIWIGTTGGGIAVFDGIAWTRYTTADGLVSNEVLDMVSRAGTLWIGTTAGVSAFNPASNSWTTYTTSDGLPSNVVDSIAVGNAPSFDLFFATGSGFARCPIPFPGSFSCTIYNTANSFLISNRVWDIAVDSFGTRWIATGGGVQRIVGATWTTYANANTPGCTVINEATSIAIDRQGGRVWFGTNRTGNTDPAPGHGACMLDTQSGTWQHFHAGNSGLANNTVNGIAVDAEGRVWLTTAPFDSNDPGGVYVCTWVSGECYWQAYTIGAGLAGNDVYGVAASLDRMWFGTGSDGLSSFALHWRRFNDEVRALASLPGQIWVGTPNGLKSYNGSQWTTQLPAVDVRAILARAPDDIWIGTFGDGAWRWDGSTWQQFLIGNSGLASDNVVALARDAQERIWFATSDTGVSVYDPASDGWALFDTSSVLPSDNVRGVAVDLSGQVWVGTTSGVSRYSGAAWDTFTTAQGLPGNIVNGLAVDALGDVWVGTSNGAARWKGTSWMSYTVANAGLPHAFVPTVHADSTGRVWLGTLGGAAVYDGTKWTAYRARNSGLLNETPRAIVTDADSGVWFGALSYTSGDINVPGGVFLRSPISGPLGLPAPIISGFVPLSGTAGTVITITGANFGPGSQVEFKTGSGNSWGRADELIRTESNITVKLPARAVQGPLRVKAAGGTATSSASFNPIPQITYINPVSGVVGTRVHIWGTNLKSPTLSQVRFGSSSWRLIGAQYNEIVTAVPTDATTGYVQVRTPGGTATSTTPFTVGMGGLTILDWQVHQGLPSYPRVAGKSTLVRLFVGTNNPQGWCAYVDRAVLRVMRQGSTPNVYVATQENGGIPESNKFCNDEVVYSEPKSIDFVIPGADLPDGAHYLEVFLESGSVTVLRQALGWYTFSSTATGDLRLHISAPGQVLWDDDDEAQSLFGQQLAALQRAYPVRDGAGSLGSANGVQYYLNTGYRVCDGTALPHCKGTGFMWDYWQQNPAGQARACTVYNMLKNAQDDNSVIRWAPLTVEEDKSGTWSFLARLRPGVTLPSDLTTLINVSTMPGGLDLDVSATLILEDGKGDCTPIVSTDIIQFVIKYTNNDDQDVDVRLTVDYDQSRINTYGPGGVIMGSTDAFLTYIQPGQFFIPEGSGGRKHDPPFDLNYNGVIDQSDLAKFVAEFEDWDPDTGEFVVSTDLTRLDPFDLIRNFRDANGNGEADDSEPKSMYLNRETTWQSVVYDGPYEYMTDYNKTHSVDAKFSGWWLWDGVNPFDFRGIAGQAAGTDKHWADLTTNNVILHEMGHNMGLVDGDSPNSSGGGRHSKNQFIPPGVAGFDPVDQADVTYMRSIMWKNAQSPLAKSFFEPFEYFELYKRFRNQASAAAMSVSNDLQFYISGQIAENDEISLNNSYLTDGLSSTPADETSAYSLRFLSGNVLLREHRIPIDFTVADPATDGPGTGAAAFHVVQPFPAGTTAIEIRHGSNTLLRREVSSTPPTVRLLTPNGGASYAGDAELFVEWTGSDADGDPLTFAVRYSANGGATWHTLTAAGTGTQLSVSLGVLPGGNNVLVEVEANDGFHTASDRSDASFSVGQKAPLWASIVSPHSGDQLVQSRLADLAGSGYDLEDGMLSGAALAWYSDRMGALGTGEAISKTLTVGEHLIALTVHDSQGLTATNTITVAVLPDFDGDGLSDDYELRYAVLNWWNADDAGADADGDGLSNLGEALWDTNPTLPDSDGDSVPDGEELAGGSSPNDPDSRPQPPELFVSATQLNFVAMFGGPNPAPEELLLISSTPAPLTWTVESDVSWLSVEPISGTTPAIVAVTIDTGELALGGHNAQVTFRSVSMRAIPVQVEIRSKYAVYLPVVLR
jgi:ligand-binding sensor domain-containing protein